ncbi:sigma-54 dependent transcriptional regulator [Acidovorax sp.]|uniref:sigma-54 dependent transcriptional regulator n=1 Tax=Acidovorax sp. TaxID=1872122 RepID=UPI002ACEF72E|nr:sigma-54 dependent transcriptional regulator [Acidovorax sp.]MDZ7867584.1 sigma-54 dependent transcriptional regulator [Acidovorax sp.]
MPAVDGPRGRTMQLVPRFARVPVIVLVWPRRPRTGLAGGRAGRLGFPHQTHRPGHAALRHRARHAQGAKLARRAARPACGRRPATDDKDGPARSACHRATARHGAARGAHAGRSVLVLGPTGSGKELVARALHACSPQSASTFVAIHCGALSAELLESELFGHLKGSFTGAYRDQPGLVEVAHGGTLFLDEVGEMPPPMQVKLLRFLQEGSFVPVGGRSQKKAEVRVVAATHRDLEAMVRDGSFREDLYYRLKGVVLRTPALSERPADVPLLATRFLHRVAPRAGLSGNALAWLAAREWPGNVRELKALVEAAGALLLKDQSEVDAPLLRLAAGEADEDLMATESAASLEGLGPLDAALAELERRPVRDAMQSAGGNQSEAARRLGISRVGLIKKLARLGLR